MTLPKIKKFTDYNHYPDEAQPTTDADMQDYMLNQNDILGALTKRLWQPQTEYKLGDIVASDTMADGLVAVCTIAGVTSDIEPEWGVNEATVIDNSCTWIMRPAYCYGLATEGDVQTVYDGGEAEVSRLLSLGVLDKIFEIFKGRIGELFGDNDVLPIANGGTGAITAKQARENLEVEPIGTIFAFAGNNIPSGYLPCNGGAISRTTYADLFAVIGTTYGGGDGSTTFNLPNLNNNSFLEGSDTVGTVKSAGLPNITGKLYITAGFMSNGDAIGVITDGEGAFYNAGNWGRKIVKSYVDANYFGGSNSEFDASRSSSVYRNDITTVQPKSVTVKFCIKY